jgi:hypothetical protein
MKAVYRMLLLALLLAGPVAVAQQHDAPPTVRAHYQIVSESGAVAYDVTEIATLSDERTESAALIRDAEHGDFVFRKSWTYHDQSVVYRLSDVRDQTFVQASGRMPFSAKTREATMEQARVIDQLPAIVLRFETNGSRWEGIPSEGGDVGAREHFRYELRMALDRFLLEAIERTRGVPFKDGVMDIFRVAFSTPVLYAASENETTMRAMRIHETAADCAFDARFGFPCSAKQLARLKKAADAGKPVVGSY